MAGLSGPDVRRPARAGLLSRARTQGGSTLVEVLIAVAIMGTGIVALITGSTTMFTASAQGRQSTTAGIAVRGYTEALNTAVAATWCAASYSVSYTPPSGYSVSASFGACPSASAAQFQTVTITATAPNGSTETVRTVVRKQ